MKEHKLLISTAPSDPVEHKKWAKKMMRIQLAMFVDDKATCEHCGYTYKNVDDFIRCNPKNGKTKKISFVCSGCWNEYENALDEHPFYTLSHDFKDAPSGVLNCSKNCSVKYRKKISHRFNRKYKREKQRSENQEKSTKKRKERKNDRGSK